MSLFQHNTMGLAEAPTEIASTTRKAWDVLFEVYGFGHFHPIEGRGVLIHALGVNTAKQHASWR